MRNKFIFLFVAIEIISVHLAYCQKDASEIQKMFQDGLNKYKSGSYNEAIIDFNNIITADPTNGKAYRMKGDAERKMKHYNSAIESYSKALAFNKNDTMSYKGRADSNRLGEKYKESIYDYNVALDYDAVDPDMHFGRAFSYYKLGEYQKSIDDYSFCIKNYPKFSLSYLGRAFTYVGRDQYLEAQEDIKKYFLLGGTDDGGYYIDGLVKTRLGDGNPPKLDSAIADLIRFINSKSGINTKDDMSYQTLALAYAKKGDSINARKNFGRSLELNPANKNTYFRWGIAELNFGNPKKANELFVQSGRMTDDPSVGYFKNLGLAKIGIGDTIEAINNFTKALAVDSTDRDTYEYRFTSLFMNNKYFKIVLSDIDHLMRFSKQANEKAEGYSLKSMVYMRVRDTTAARNEVEKAIKLMPEEPIYYMLRAYISANTGKDKSIVLKDVNKVIDIDPSMIDAYLFKATYYSNQGDFKNGCETLNFALKIGAKVSKEVRDYICKGKRLKGGKGPDLFIPLVPRLKRMDKFNDQ